MPVSRCYAGTCAYTNQLYVIGGCDAKGWKIYNNNYIIFLLWNNIKHLPLINWISSKLVSSSDNRIWGILKLFKIIWTSLKKLNRFLGEATNTVLCFDGKERTYGCPLNIARASPAIIIVRLFQPIDLIRHVSINKVMHAQNDYGNIT